MPETVETSDAHWCDNCFKTYQRRDLLLRHRRRCLRSNKATTRQKACHACVLAKSKCCYSQPSCTRCTKRGLACVYVTSATSAPTNDDSSKPLNTRSRTADSAPVTSDHSPSGGSVADQFDPIWGTQGFAWPLDMIDISPLPSSAASSSYQPLDFSLTSSPVTLGTYGELPSESSTTAVASAYPAVSDLSLIPSLGVGVLDAIPSPPYGETSRKGGTAVRVSQCLRLLLQYPQLLLQDDFYSPFVHRILFNDQVQDMTILRHSSMALCCGGGLEAKEASRYIKRAMDAQRHSLIEAYPTYYCMEQWDALHAMLLYEVLELGLPPVDESDNWKQTTRPRGLRSPFLSKMTQCFSRCYLKTHDASLVPAPDTSMSWNQWAVVETARRTIFLANIIIFFGNRDLASGRQSPYYEPLNDDLILSLPLPCSHALWAARSEDEWRKMLQYEKSAPPSNTDPFAAFTPPHGPGTNSSESGPSSDSHWSLKFLLSKFTKDYIRLHLGTPGFRDSNELRSFIILCALEQFP